MLQYLNVDYYLTQYDTSAERTKDWFYLKSSSLMHITILCYLAFVTVIGPRFMKNRKPYTLKSAIQIYNVFQVFSCVYLVRNYMKSGIKLSHIVECHKSQYTSVDEESLNLAKTFYLNLMLRVLELIETVFFVLRKKNNQVTLLHVYHHISTIFLVYVGAKYVGGGGPFGIALPLNCCVHVVMYSYYFLASLGPAVQKRIAVLKRFITQIQLIQFVILLVSSIIMYQTENCVDQINFVMGYLFLFDLVVMIYMFGQFYISSYSEKKLAAA